jgi:hypothetical protein
MKQMKLCVIAMGRRGIVYPIIKPDEEIRGRESLIRMM